MIYELPTKVINISEENDKFVGLIAENVCNKYNIHEIKTKLSCMFTKFNKVKFYYITPISDTIQITTSYGENGRRKKSVLSKEELAVTNKIDSMIWASDFYNKVLSLSKGLTFSEAIYLSYGLIACKSNEYIAEILHVSPRSVQPVKKSCMIKAWAALETLYDEDE